jgi:ubiquinone/menaquinone biosynthesis C-methylase UbiE
MHRRQHWDAVYMTKAESEVSWFEPIPEISLRMMERAGLSQDTCVLDVGGGDSHLVDQLAARGLDCLAVLDVSEAALLRAKSRLGTAASIPMWINADVTADWALKPMDMWHDRAVFHFLTIAADRQRYVAQMRVILKQHGTAIIATFAPDGPETCSGLPVARYSPAALAAELGSEFALVESVDHVHTTPWGSAQSFQYSRFQRHHN